MNVNIVPDMNPKHSLGAFSKKWRAFYIYTAENLNLMKRIKKEFSLIKKIKVKALPDHSLSLKYSNETWKLQFFSGNTIIVYLNGGLIDLIDINKDTEYKNDNYYIIKKLKTILSPNSIKFIKDL